MNTRRKDFGRAIEYASAVGATCLVAWTGSFSTDLMKEDSRNRDSQVANQIARFLNTYWKAIDDARLHLALETYITLACPDAASLAALLDTLPAAAGAVLDPPNLTPPARYADRDQVLKEMVQLLGQRTKIVHLKDFRIRPGGQAYDLPGPLQGEMNYKLFAALLETIPAGVPVIAEHLAPAEFASARQRLLAVL